MSISTTSIQEVDQSGTAVGSATVYEANTLSTFGMDPPGTIITNLGKVLAARVGALMTQFSGGGGGGSTRPTAGMIYPRGQG